MVTSLFAPAPTAIRPGVGATPTMQRPAVRHAGLLPAIRFASTIPVDPSSKIDDDVYDLITHAYKNELHLHQSGSSDIAFLKYALLREIRDGKITKMVKFNVKTRTQEEIDFSKLDAEQMRKALEELLDWESLREYFRFYIQGEHGKPFLSSNAIAEASGHKMTIPDGIPDGVEAQEYFDQLREFGLNAYRATSAKINPLVKNLPAAYLLAHMYAWDVSGENIRYAEYRISPVGKNYASYQCSTEDLMHAVSEGFEDARRRIAPGRRKLDYGLIVLMERQGAKIVKDPKKLVLDLQAAFVKHGLQGASAFNPKWLRPDAILKEAIRLVSAQERVADEAGFKADVLKALIDNGFNFVQPEQASVRGLLGRAAKRAIDNERQKAQDALELARETVRLRDKYNIVGIDLAGDELNNPVSEFAEAFKVIREYNDSLPPDQRHKRIGITIHAGETSHSGDMEGWQSIRRAIDLAWSPNTPVRIGHGVQLINSSPELKQAFEEYLQDPKGWTRKIDLKQLYESNPLLKEVIEKGIVLEMCPKSNLQTYGVHPGLAKGQPDVPGEKYSARAYKKHPAVFLSRLGVKVAISSDNRTISNTDVANEFVKLFKYAGLTYDDFKKMVLDGFEGAFIFDEKKKQEMIEEAKERFRSMEHDTRFLKAMRKMGKQLDPYQEFIVWRERAFNQIWDKLETLWERVKTWIERLVGNSRGTHPA